MPKDNKIMDDIHKDIPEDFKQPEPEFAFWMAGPELTKLAGGVKKWWDKVGGWALWPSQQIDPLTCPVPVLNLIAWQRNISRYSGEPERLFRLRVKYAYANGKDSGSTAGWQRIFKRLELGKVELDERVKDQDWDVVDILMDDADLPDAQNVLEIIISDYGRTCRRYRFRSQIEHTLNIRVGTFDDCHTTVNAAPSSLAMVETTPHIGVFDLHHHTSFAEA